jgi:hypothetical protein
MNALLDLFDPMSLVHTVMYQSKTDADYWEQQHITAINDVCQYIKDVYPNMYNRVESIHQRFLNMQPTLY